MRSLLYKALPSRLALWLFGMLCATAAMAQTALSVEDFFIAPGQAKQVAVNFSNADGIAALQADFILPEGITYVDFKVNQDRVQRGVHSATVTRQANGAYRILIWPSSLETIGGEQGELLQLEFEATEGFSTKQQVQFFNIEFSDISAKKYLQEAFNVGVNPRVGNVGVSEEQFEIAPGTKHRVSISLENLIPVYGVQGRIVLPEGLSIEKNDKGRYAWTYGDRLPQNAAVSYNPDNGMFVLNDMYATQDFGTSGVLFSFNVVADENLAEESQIVVSDFVLSGTRDISYDVEDRLTVQVVRVQSEQEANEAQHTADLAAIAAVQTALDEANQAIAAYDASVQAAVAEKAAAVQAAIDALKTTADASYEAGTSVADTEALNAEIVRVQQLVQELVDTAAAAQATFEANEAQHEADLAALQSLKEAVVQMKSSLEAVAPEVQEALAADVAAVEAAVDSLVSVANASYEAGTAVADSEALQAGIDEVAASVAEVLANAEALQVAYEANEAQYAADLEVVAGVQQKFEKVMEKIATYDVSVAEAVAEDVANVQQAIERLAAMAEQSHENGSSVDDANLLQSMAYNVESLIAALDNKAEIEQQKFISSGIENVTIGADGKSIYDLSGRRLKEAKGFVIFGNQKRIVK